MAPCLHELHVEDTGDDVIMMPKYEWEHKQKEMNEVDPEIRASW